VANVVRRQWDLVYAPNAEGPMLTSREFDAHRAAGFVLSVPTHQQTESGGSEDSVRECSPRIDCRPHMALSVLRVRSRPIKDPPLWDQVPWGVACTARHKYPSPCRGARELCSTSVSIPLESPGMSVSSGEDVHLSSPAARNREAGLRFNSAHLPSEDGPV
jgi:hypothetical protein